MEDIWTTDWQRRKKLRTEYYEKYVKGNKLEECNACAGSGYYDHNGSSSCGSCDGTGKTHVRYLPFRTF